MAKQTLNVNSVNKYMANYEWDDDLDDLNAMDAKRADNSELFFAGYEVDSDGKVVPRKEKREWI